MTTIDLGIANSWDEEEMELFRRLDTFVRSKPLNTLVSTEENGTTKYTRSSKSVSIKWEVHYD